MIFHFGFISGLMFGIEVEFPSEWTGGALLIDLGIFRIVIERL